MSVTFRILANRGLVYIRYSGRMTVAESDRAVAVYLADRAYAPGQKQLLDLTGVTEWERDFPRLLALQARKAEAFYDPVAPVFVVAVAPTPLTQKVADFISRSWDGIDGITYRVAETEADALDLLGQPERAVGTLLAAV